MGSSVGNSLSDFNPEIKKLPLWMEKEFNNRYEKQPEAWYLLLRVRDCWEIVEKEKAEQERVSRNKLIKERAIREQEEAAKKKRVEKEMLEKLLKIENQQNFLKALDQLEDWQRFYKEEFDIVIDIKNLDIPKRSKGADILMVVAEGITPNAVFEKLSKRVDVNAYIFDLNTIDSERKPNQTYAIWLAISPVENSDGRLGISLLTIEERLLLELIDLERMGEYLEKYRWRAACLGSIDLGGCSPFIYWDRNKQSLIIDWCRSLWMDDLETVCRMRFY